MYLNAWLIRNDNEHVLDDLTAPDGRSRAMVWIPLKVTHESKTEVLPEFRSAFGYRHHDGEEWVDFAMPPQVVREWLGPQAIVHPKCLALGKASGSNVRTNDGIVEVKVPRYFDTLGSAWTFEPVGRDPLVTRSGEETNQTTVCDLDIDASFRHFMAEPVAIIDSSGPRVFARRRDSYYNVGEMTRSSTVLESIAQRSPDTVVRCVWFTF